MERSFLPGFKDYLPRLNDSERKNLNLRQILVMPIAAEHDSDTAEIAICLESSSSMPYNDHEKELLKAFAGVAGFAYNRARKYEQGCDQAMRDGHTGLINKKTMFEKLRAEKVRADRSKYSIGLLMMDIDHFKHVNDTYGHPIGDVVIKGIADTISKEIRGEIDVVARFGGEEFVVALIDTNAEGMVETAERIRKSVEKLVFDVHQAEPLRVTVSVGAFLLTQGFNGDLQKAINNADQALYRAKEGGRNQVVQFQTAEAEPAAV
jgi:diguanylate cyclase (GGDEF)-like protein